MSVVERLVRLELTPTGWWPVALPLGDGRLVEVEFISTGSPPRSRSQEWESNPQRLAYETSLKPFLRCVAFPYFFAPGTPWVVGAICQGPTPKAIVASGGVEPRLYHGTARRDAKDSRLFSTGCPGPLAVEIYSTSSAPNVKQESYQNRSP